MGAAAAAAAVGLLLRAAGVRGAPEGAGGVIQVFLAPGAIFRSAVKSSPQNALEGKLLLEGFWFNDLELFFFRPPKNGPQKYP